MSAITSRAAVCCCPRPSPTLLSSSPASTLLSTAGGLGGSRGSSAATLPLVRSRVYHVYHHHITSPHKALRGPPLLLGRRVGRMLPTQRQWTSSAAPPPTGGHGGPNSTSSTPPPPPPPLPAMFRPALVLQTVKRIVSFGFRLARSVLLIVAGGFIFLIYLTSKAAEQIPKSVVLKVQPSYLWSSTCFRVLTLLTMMAAVYVIRHT